MTPLELSFHPYKEHLKRTLYAAWASILVRAAPVLRDGLKLEFLWASTLETRTESTSDLLHDLDTLAGLLSLDAMHQSWSYAWVSCPPHPPLLEEKPSSTSSVLESDSAQNKGERGCENKGNQNYYEEGYDHVSNCGMSHLA